jgi:hypothetical protein
MHEKDPSFPINDLDDFTDKILDKCYNPKESGSWDRRGMVVGHVQSGKTSNYVGLINKATDAGYKVIIVIAGTISSLRRQTQERIDEGYIGKSSSAYINNYGENKNDWYDNCNKINFTEENYKNSVIKMIGLNETLIVKNEEPEKINNDEFEDAIITVNRFQFAKNKSAGLKNANQIADMGYLGNYNYFVFYDGKLDKFSVPVPVPSSPINKLKVKFENLSSEKYKDLIIEYRVLSASFRNYYTIYGDVLQEIFQVKIFDHLGESKPEAYFFENDKGSICDVKNIMVYEGKILNYPSKIENIYQFEPEIVKTNTLHKRWFFNPKVMKYMTEDPELMKN